jgi:pimeloyl-ACP methyl ester carboxylesterase
VPHAPLGIGHELVLAVESGSESGEEPDEFRTVKGRKRGQSIFETGFRTVSPYLRGYHPATLSDRGFDTNDLADDVALLMDALGEAAAVVVGHDWGAEATYGSATKYPQRVIKMVALGISHPMTLKPSLSAAWAGRHFVYFRFPWAQATARLFGLRLVGRLYRRWAPSWSGQAASAAC